MAADAEVENQRERGISEPLPPPWAERIEFINIKKYKKLNYFITDQNLNMSKYQISL